MAAAVELRPGELADVVLAWYDGAARDLPWRRRDTTPWAVLVSEVMLQQTPVSRVLPAYERWIERWPTPAALAAEPAGAAIRAWDRLGYPRRALRLHATARRIVEQYGGAVPDDLAALLALPGLGTYTARAVASFAFSQRHPVVDTNVRRVLARVLRGEAAAPAAGLAADLRRAETLLPADPADAARFGVAFMELGALVCTARAPHCAACPLAGTCAWKGAGRPRASGVPARRQSYAGTDREARGALLVVLRAADGTAGTSRTELLATWPDGAQAARALAGLLADGLAVGLGGDTVALP